jgi:hypothetical protein
MTIQLKPNFIRNLQPHQSRKKERGKVIVKNRRIAEWRLSCFVVSGVVLFWFFFCNFSSFAVLE